MPTATEYAAELVASVRDDPPGRVALMRSLYDAEPGRPELHLPYRRAALGFMGWQLPRGLLDPLDGDAPGSPWWRAVNERLLTDTAEARAHALGLSGPMSSWSASCCAEFAQNPWARSSCQDHNASIVAAYLDHRELNGVDDRLEGERVVSRAGQPAPEPREERLGTQEPHVRAVDAAAMNAAGRGFAACQIRSSSEGPYFT